MDDHNHDTWTDLQAFKSRQNSLREKLQRRKKEREDILASSTIIVTTDKVRSPIISTSGDNNGLHSSKNTTGNNRNSVGGVNSISTATVANDYYHKPTTDITGTTLPKERLSSLGDNSASITSSDPTQQQSETIKDVVGLTNTTTTSTSTTNINGDVNNFDQQTVKSFVNDRLSSSSSSSSSSPPSIVTLIETERKLLQCLCDAALKMPIDSRLLLTGIRKSINFEKSDHSMVVNLLDKFAHQGLIQVVQELKTSDGETCVVVSSADHSKLTQFFQQSNDERKVEPDEDNLDKGSFKRPIDGTSSAEKLNKTVKIQSTASTCAIVESSIVDEVNVESLLSLESTRERETKKMGEELLELLSKPTVKERSLVERFRSVGGGQVQEFCAHGTKEECVKQSAHQSPCERLHFKKIIQKHTDETLGDCSFLNTCFHMDSCKYVHYKVDYSTVKSTKQPTRKEVLTTQRFKSVLYPPQWLQCDLRFFDMTILGKFAVVMADPPWDIHMELPYGTLSDDEMRKLNIPSLQDEGLIFLWVTGRAMELGRECLKLWGYERCDEIIWVKTNQLQRIIRTGRTGHWLNHGKEHCLVGIKGQPKDINRGLDCDVIVAEVRATSHKPDEIYGIIERLSPGTKKIELFGRPHNVQPNWITLGNQLDGVRLIDPELIEAFKKRYQDGNCMAKQS